MGKMIGKYILIFVLLIVNTSYISIKEFKKSKVYSVCDIPLHEGKIIGKMYGNNFVLQESHVRISSSFFKEENATYELTFYNKRTKDVCNNDQYQKEEEAQWGSFTIKGPVENGEYSTSHSDDRRMMGFYFVNKKKGNSYQMKSATCGLVEIISIDDNIIKGKLIAYKDKDNFVNGFFEATICAQ